LKSVDLPTLGRPIRATFKLILWDNFSVNRFKKNLENFTAQLNSICASCNRNPTDIQLVAITKNHSAEEVNGLIQSGVSSIGENRLQEALGKFPDSAECKKHFVGHIQSNKAREIAQNFDVVESVGSVKVAKILNDSVTKPLPIFLQVNLANEFQKSGFLKEDLAKAVVEIRKLPNIKIEGLMIMGVLGNAEKTREVFAQAKKLSDQFGFENLSAGMSGDWQIAVEEGATHLRIGSLLFE